MADVEIYDQHGGLVGPGASWRVAWATARHYDSGQVRTAQIEVEQALVVRKIQAVGAVVRQAQTEAALITQTEQALALAAPAASGRLAQISELGMVGLSETVLCGARRIGRC